MNNAIYGEAVEDLRNRTDVKLINNEKGYLKCSSKPSQILHKIFGNNLVAIRKSKFALKLSKAAYIGMCISELSKVLLYKFHYNYIKNKYGNKSKLFLTDTDSLMYEIKTEMSVKILAAIEKCLILVVIQLNQNIMMIVTNQSLEK